LYSTESKEHAWSASERGICHSRSYTSDFLLAQATRFFEITNVWWWLHKRQMLAIKAAILKNQSINFVLAPYWLDKL